MITINNPTKKDELKRWLSDKAKYYVSQHEVGEEGTLHIQGYIIFKGNQRLAGLKKLHSKAHWEVRKGTHEQARAYCTKIETAVIGTMVEFGDPPAPGKRSDLIAMKETIDANPLIQMEEVFEKHFATALRYSAHIKEYIALKATKRHWKTIVTVLWGPPGTGKSKLSHDVSPDAFVKDCTTKWWDNYDGVADVILDDFYGGIQMTTMLSLLDRYKCQVECKGGVINFAPKRIFITSNKKYTEWYSKPEGTSDEAWESRILAIERRIDNLLTLPELGVVHVVKGEIPAKPAEIIVIPAAVPVPVPLPKTPTFVIDYDDDDEDESDDDSEEEDEEEESPDPPRLKHAKGFVPPRKVSKKRKYRTPTNSSSDEDY